MTPTISRTSSLRSRGPITCVHSMSGARPRRRPGWHIIFLTPRFRPADRAAQTQVSGAPRAEAIVSQERKMQERLAFTSDGLKLSAVLHVPEKRRPSERLPAFIVLHGFVGSKDESHAEIQ